MAVAGLAVALRADKHRAQARFVEEGLGREVRAARGVSPRVQLDYLVSAFYKTVQPGPFGPKHFPWQTHNFEPSHPAGRVLLR